MVRQLLHETLKDQKGNPYVEEFVMFLRNDFRKLALFPAVVIAAAIGKSEVKAQPSFDAAFEIQSGARPDSVAHGDWDGDGLVDLAVTVDNPDRVLIYFGNGDGSFAAPATFFTGGGTGPGHVAAARLDADADLDLVVALKNVNTILVMINNGSGAFTSGGTFAVGTEPRQVALGDLDNDLDIDAAVANRNSGDVSILLNNGSGMFGAATTVAVGTEVRGVAILDYDGDSDLDLAATDHDGRSVVLLNNDGSGVFAVATQLSVGGAVRPDGVVAADLDGQNGMDLAVSTSGTGLNFVTVFRNNGDATFSGPSNFAVNGINPGPIVAGDFDCDLDIDVATANTDSANVSVLANNGAGSLGPAQVFGVGLDPNHIAAADIDGNGLDLIVANDGSNDFSVLINQSTACFTFCGDGSCDASEDQCSCPADCGAPPTGEVVGSTCQDGLDNDCDGMSDCADSDCASDTACGSVCGDGTCDAGDDSCNCPADCGAPPTNELVNSTCQDGLDNDCDGMADCADGDCVADPGCATGCVNDTNCDDGDIRTIDRCVSNMCTFEPAMYGDIAGPSNQCGPDGTIDISDIFAVLDAFTGNSTCGVQRQR